MEKLTTLYLALEGYTYEPHNLYECYWLGPAGRIRQLLCCRQTGEAGMPPDVFFTLAGRALLTVDDLNDVL